MFSARLFLIPIPAVLALCGLACESAPPGQFRADITIGDLDKITTGRIRVHDSVYRLDLTEGGEHWFVVVDEKANISRTFSPEYKTYVEVPANDKRSYLVDPIQGQRYLHGIGEVRDYGVKNVAGYECSLYVVSINRQPMVTEYYSPELGFILKTENHISRDLFLRIDNIEQVTIPDSVFAIPSGYRPKGEAGEGPVEVPSWISDLTAVETTIPPFEMTVAAGELFRVAVEPGFGLDVRGRNVGDGNASFSAVPFLLDLPIKDVSIYTLNLPKRGTSGGWTFEETPLEAEEIVVRVNEGRINFTVQQIELGFGETVAAGEKYRQTVLPNRQIIVRMVNVDETESSCAVTLTRDGTPLEGDTVGPLSFRSVSLKTKHASERRTYTADADEIVIEVQKGRMLINVRQP